MATGRIFNIQRFSIHDGPGIRTIVFFKGCHMRCAWCSNPESQAYEPEAMRDGKRTKLVGRDVTVDEIMPEILADIPYYKRSGGGLTLSGGEVLCQPEFARELLDAAKAHGLNTAVETASFAPFEAMESLMPFVDLWLADVKHIDSAKHREYTGTPNELILENLRRLTDAGANVIIRTPLIPHFNDTADEIRAIARFAASLKGVREHHLLPFHRLGKDKYDGLGRRYAFGEEEPPSKEKAEYLLSVAEEAGLKCRIGG